jgi:hypothetical protein
VRRVNATQLIESVLTVIISPLIIVGLFLAVRDTGLLAYLPEENRAPITNHRSLLDKGPYYAFLGVFSSCLMFIAFSVRECLERSRLVHRLSSATRIRSHLMLHIAGAILPHTRRHATVETWREESTAVERELGILAAWRYRSGLIAAAIGISIEHWKHGVVASASVIGVKSVDTAVTSQKKRSLSYRFWIVIGVLGLCRIASIIIGFDFQICVEGLAVGVIGNSLYDTLRGR